MVYVRCVRVCVYTFTYCKNNDSTLINSVFVTTLQNITLVNIENLLYFVEDFCTYIHKRFYFPVTSLSGFW